MKSLKVLDLGCGERKHRIENAEVIGLDKYKVKDVDVVHDLEKTPLPFKNNYFDKIIAHSVIEHINNFFPVMDELYRILKPNGIIDIYVPNAYGHDAFNHPDHKKFFGIGSFNYFEENTAEAWYMKRKARFKILKKEFKFLHYKTKYKLFNTLISPLLNVWQGFIEKFLPFLPDEIHFVLKKITC